MKNIFLQLVHCSWIQYRFVIFSIQSPLCSVFSSASLLAGFLFKKNSFGHVRGQSFTASNPSSSEWKVFPPIASLRGPKLSRYGGCGWHSKRLSSIVAATDNTTSHRTSSMRLSVVMLHQDASTGQSTTFWSDCRFQMIPREVAICDTGTASGV